MEYIFCLAKLNWNIYFCILLLIVSPAEHLEGMLRDYVTQSEYPSNERLRDLLNKVPDRQKLKILQKSYGPDDKSQFSGRGTPLHTAVERGDSEMIANILSSLQSSDRLKLLMAKRYTPLHRAVRGSDKESVKAILNSLTLGQQLGLLSAEWGSKTATKWASAMRSEYYVNMTVPNCSYLVPVLR